MTSSGTNAFFPDIPNIIIEAFDNIGIRGAALTRSKLQSARRSLNLELQEWSIKGLNLWAIELETIPLVVSTATYNLDTTTISILDAYITSSSTDRILTPLSRSDYAAIANKTQEGAPTSFWFNRASPVPTVTFWLVPDASSTYTFNYYRMRRIEDAGLVGAQTPDVPYRFLDALVKGLTKRLAQKFKRSIYLPAKAEADQAWLLATTEDRESVPIRISPNLSGYYS